MSPGYNLRPRPVRKTRPSNVTINALNDDDFFLIFDNFKLKNLFPLRLVNHRWDALVQNKFSNRTELTVQVKGANSMVYYRRQRKYGQLFYVDNIEDALTKKAASNEHEDPIESVGELISIQIQNVNLFSATLRRLLADNLQILVVHWESADSRQVSLLTLVNACPNLTRLSLWTPAPEPLFDSIQTSILNLVQQLCEILPQKESLTWLDLNCYHENVQIRFLETHLQQLLPQLERLSLCHFAKDPIGLLAQASPLLTHLKLDCAFPDFTSEQFHHLLTELNPSLATSITTLSLQSPTISMLEVTPAFINLHTLKLQVISRDYIHWSSRDYYKREFNIDYELLTTLAQIPSLRKLLMLDYDFLPTHPRPCSLPSVTSLTLTSTTMLFHHFKNEADPNRPGFRRVNVPAFCTALFAQFPSLKELTLVGPVFQQEIVRHRLEGALKPRLDKLNMFFEDFIDYEGAFGGGRTKKTARKSLCGYKHIFSGRQTARKGSTSRAQELQLYLKAIKNN